MMDQNHNSDNQADSSESQNQVATQLNKAAQPVQTEHEETSEARQELDAQEEENRANAMTDDFAVSMGWRSTYNDNLDMDQQSQEYWDNL